MNASAVVGQALNRATQRAALVELIGTFLLATAAFLSGNGLVVGLTLLVLVYAIGNQSGCHINPGVTVGLIAARQFPFGAGIVYIVAQIIGAVLARLVIGLLGTAHVLASAGFYAEFIGFAFLILAVMAVTKNQVPATGSGIAIGAGLAAGLVATNGILNPAIAIAAGHIISWAVLMPLLSGLAFGLLYNVVLHNIRPPQ